MPTDVQIHTTCSNVHFYASRHTSIIHMHTSIYISYMIYAYSRITHIHSFKDTYIQLFLYSQNMIYDIFLYRYMILYDLFT